MADDKQTHNTNISLRHVLIAVFTGIFTGIFFGESARILQPIGQLFILLLEVAVYPYIICSLLYGLGSMQPSQSWRLFRAGWPFYLGLWVVVFGMLWLLTLAIPAPRALVLQAGANGFSADKLLDLLIPSDIVAALTNNSIPAVILFCLFYGIALQHVKEKRALLDALNAMAGASLKFWNAVVRLVPFAVFALFASTAGTIQISDVESIGYFLILFYAGALLLIVWLIPACLAALLPVRFRQVTGDLRSALMIGLVTTISVSALPFVVAATRKLAVQCGIDDPERDDVIRTNISVAYPLGQLGNFFVYFFIVFCAFLMHVEIPITNHILLPFVSLLSCFGSPTASVNSALFLGNWLGIGPEAQNLYVELMTILRYPQVAASIMGFGFLSFTVVLAYYGKLRVRPARLVACLGVTACLLAIAALGSRNFYTRYVANAPSPYLGFTLPAGLTAHADVRFLHPAEMATSPRRSAASLLNQIRQSGVLRIGYNPSVIPFCYRNQAGDLVGYDVAFAYKLARDMNVRLEWVPFSWPNLAGDIQAGKFDIAMAGIYVTKDRLNQFLLSEPYYQSALAFFAPRSVAGKFRDRKSIEENTNLRIGTFDDPVLVPWLRKLVPEDQIVIVPDYNTLPDFKKVDGAFWSLVQSEAIAAANPGIIAVKPRNLGTPVLFTYLMRKNAVQLQKYLNYWLELQRANGFEQAQRSYWFERHPRKQNEKRWSILRNVLHVDW